jgi:hypothetical protein
MKRIVTLLPVLLCSAILALASEIPIVDKPAAGSPLANSGTVVTDSSPEGSTEGPPRYEDNWTVANVSNKPILALQQTLIVRYDDGSERVHEGSFEAFFSPTPLQPKASVTFSAQKGSEVGHAGGPSSPATAEVVVRWVQFADGTTFGDPAYAQELLAGRKALFEILANLSQVYLVQGPDAFEKQLQAESSTNAEVGGFLLNLRRLQASSGTRAIAVIRMYLSNADGRKGML